VIERAVVERDWRVRAGIGDDVEHRHRFRFQGAAKRRLEIGRDLDRIAATASGSCDRRMVDVAEVSGRCIAAKFHLLGVLLIAKDGVVDHDDRCRDSVTNRRFQLEHGALQLQHARAPPS
jgi:hypothetical protein